MKIRAYNFIYFIKLAFKGMFKNGVMTLASIVILMSCLIVMGSSWCIGENLEVNLDKLDGYNKIVVFVKENTEDFAVQEVGKRLEALKGVEKVEFTSKHEVLEDLTAQYEEHKELFSDFQGENNFLKDQFTVTYSDNASVATLQYQIEQIDNVSKINANVETAGKIDSLKNIITLVFSWLMVLLFVVSLFVIGNTLKLSIFARRDEIAIMRYIGGTGFFVSAPFYIESLIIGAVSGGIGFGVQYYLYKYFVIELLGDYEIISVIPFAQLAYPLLGMFLLAGTLAGVIGCIISLRKYNKV